MTIRWNPSGIALIFLASCFIFYVFRNAMFLSFPAWNSASRINLRTLLCTSILAAERGGLEVKRIHEAQLLNAKNKGSSDIKNPVTDGDIRSHFAMTSTLKLAFPNLQVISEEHGTTEKPTDIHFEKMDNSCTTRIDILKAFPHDAYVDVSDMQLWIDPLDATQEYTENLLNYVTTMVGIAIKGVAVAGIIHKPFAENDDEKTFWAWSEYGTSDNLKVFNQENQSVLRIIVSRSHSGDVEKVARTAFAGRVVEIIPAGGAGFKSLQVIAQKADVYLHTTKIKKWDLCAPNGILNALGGRMTTLKGAEIDYLYPTDERGAVNLDGVVAALHNHHRYVEIFKSVPKTT